MRVIAIAGGTGSGKSTLARAVAEPLGAQILAIDDYYRPLNHLTFEERDRVNFDDPAAIDDDLLLAHVASLLAGQAVQKPRYDFSRHTRYASDEIFEPGALLIVEGIFALCWPRLNALCAERIFVDAPVDLRFQRRLERDVMERGRDTLEVTRRFRNHVEPMHRLHVEPTRARSTLVLRGDGPLDTSMNELLGVTQGPAALR